jgi:ATP-dependent DNA helicase RecG
MNSGIDDILKKSIQCIKGVAEKRSKLFHKLGVFSVCDLITFFPRGYEDRSKLKKISQMENGEECTFEGIVMSKVSEKRIRKGLSIYQVYVKDDTGTVIATWFNQPFVKKLANKPEYMLK